MSKQTAIRSLSRAPVPPPQVVFSLPENQREALEEALACMTDAYDALAGAIDLALAARPGETIACERIAALLSSPVQEVLQARDCLRVLEGDDHASSH